MNNKKKIEEIGIIGYGVVGKAINLTMQKSFDTKKYDKYIDYDAFGDVANCDFVFISVPTPFNKKTGKLDDKAIVESLDNLSDCNFNGTVVIKSTIIPGTTNHFLDKYSFNICINPEFLRESINPNKDFANQDLVVIGTSEKRIFDSVKAMYQEVLNKNTKYFHVSPTEAEMIKCAQNTMLASRIALANMIYDACQNYGTDYDKIRQIAFDNFEILGPHLVQVPGPDSHRGFGGKCLPKDILAFSTIHDSELLRKIIEYNNTLRNDIPKKNEE